MKLPNDHYLPEFIPLTNTYKLEGYSEGGFLITRHGHRKLPASAYTF